MRGADTFTESLFDASPGRLCAGAAPVAADPGDGESGAQGYRTLLSGMYAADVKGGRPSIAPEKLLRAMLLQIFYSIRSERQLMEQTQYNLLFRWFIGLSMDDAVWVPTVFTKNRERLIAHDAVIELFNAVLAIAEKQNWLSGEHFSDGTLPSRLGRDTACSLRKDGWGDGRWRRSVSQASFAAHHPSVQ